MNKPIKKNQDQSIILTGFMGVGKTSVGERLAAKLNREFIDIDQVIEAAYHMPTTEIFQKIGEKAFRKKEKDTVIHYAQQSQKIISLGGGAFMQQAIRNACLTYGMVIHLDISWNTWHERMHTLLESRPVLQGKSTEEIKNLFTERRETYVKSHNRILTDQQTEDEIAEQILTMFNKHTQK